MHISKNKKNKNIIYIILTQKTAQTTLCQIIAYANTNPSSSHGWPRL